MADFRSNRNVLFSCKYHVVFCPKYRKPVLNPPIDAKLKKLIQQVCDETQSELIEMQVVPDDCRTPLTALCAAPIAKQCDSNCG
jgi:putative transposase